VHTAFKGYDGHEFGLLHDAKHRHMFCACALRGVALLCANGWMAWYVMQSVHVFRAVFAVVVHVPMLCALGLEVLCTSSLSNNRRTLSKELSTRLTPMSVTGIGLACITACIGVREACVLLLQHSLLELWKDRARVCVFVLVCV
jgi:hypothetical protein